MPKPPFSQKMVTRFLVLVVICLALLAGYYHSLQVTTAKKLQILEKRHAELIELTSDGTVDTQLNTSSEEAPE